MKLNIQIKAYYVSYLNRCIQSIEHYLHKELAVQKTQIFLPQKIEKYTLLRSPHADKKARDQFERKTYKRLIVLNLPKTYANRLHLQNFLQKLQVSAVGVEFRITTIARVENYSSKM